LTYTDHLEATGTGYSLKIGTIIKPVEFIRLGLAFHSPVVYRISEYYYDNISSEFDSPGSDGNTGYEASNNPMRYKYTFTTPFRVIAGVAVQIKKLALISADYEIIDYRMSRFSKASDDYNYYDENQSIKNILKTTSNLRLGAEFRLNNIYLRSGYSYYGKAFNANEDNKDLNYNALSFGFGMRQKNFFFDMAFTTLSATSKYYLYNDPGYLDPAAIKKVKNTFAATFGVKF
jgi:long-subunit fatty acid transport protein